MVGLGADGGAARDADASSPTRDDAFTPAVAPGCPTRLVEAASFRFPLGAYTTSGRLVAAPNGGFVVALSIRPEAPRVGHRPYLYRFREPGEAPVITVLDAPLPGEQVLTTALAAQGDTLWLGGTQARNQRKVLVRIDRGATPPFPSHVFSVPDSYSFWPLRPNDDGTVDVSYGYLHPRPPVVHRITLEGDTVAGPTPVLPGSPAPGENGWWVPEGDLVLEYRLRSDDDRQRILVRVMDVETGPGEAREVLTVEREERVLHPGAFDVTPDGSLLLPVWDLPLSGVPFDAADGVVYRLAPGADAMEEHFRRPRSRRGTLVAQDDGCGSVVLFRTGTSERGHPTGADLILLDPAGRPIHVLRDALVAGDADPCLAFPQHLAWAPGRLGMVWVDGCEPARRSTHFRWYRLE